MIKVILFSLYTVLISTTLGLVLNKRIKFLNDGFAAPIGFAVLMAGLQLLYYPAQLFNFPSAYIHIISSLVYVGLFIVTVLNIKEVFKNLFSLKTIWIIVTTIFFLAVFYNVSVSLDFEDTQMYLNYMSQNINAAELNNFNIWTGLYGEEWDSIYLFQGYYHFGSFASYIVNVFNYLFGIGGFVENIVTQTWGLGLIYSIVSSMLFYNIVDYFIEDKWFRRVVMMFTLFFSNFYYWRVAFSFYGNTFRTLYICVLLFYLYRYFKEDNKEFKYISIIIMTAGIAFSSSYLFIAFSIMYGLMVFLFNEREKDTIREMADFVFPIVVYAVAKFSKDNMVIAIIGSVLAAAYYLFRNQDVFIKITDNIELFLNKHAVRIFMIIIPTIAVLFSIYYYFIGNPDYPYNFLHYFQNHQRYDMVKDYYFIYSYFMDNLLNVVRWIGIIFLLVYKGKNQGIRFFKYLIIIMFVLFLNPLSTSFIAEMIASNVYYRSFEVVFNPLTETLLLVLIYQKFSSKKPIIVILALVLVSNTLFTHIASWYNIEGGGYNFYIKEGQTVDPIFKLYPEDYEVLVKFRDIIEEDENSEQINIISHAEGVRTFTPDVYQLFTARQYFYPWDRVNEEFWQQSRRHYSWIEFDEIDYSNTCGYIAEFDVDYVLVKYWENWEFDIATDGCMVTIEETPEYKIKRRK